jgi:hypothetical protein
MHVRFWYRGIGPSSIDRFLENGLKRARLSDGKASQLFGQVDYGDMDMNWPTVKER